MTLIIFSEIVFALITLGANMLPLLTVVLLAGVALGLFSGYLLFRRKMPTPTIRFDQGSPLEGEALLRTIIDNLHEVIYVKDINSRFVVGNRKLSRVMKAKSPQHLVGRTDHDFYPKNLAELFYRDEQEIMRSGLAIINKIEPGYDEDGNERIISTSKIPLRNHEGTIIGIVGIGKDVTTEKQNEKRLIEQASSLQEINTMLEERQEEIKVQSEHLEDERNQLRTLIDSLPDVIYVKDTESRFIIANKPLAEVMKAGSPEQLVGLTDFDFYDKALAEQFYNDEQEVIRTGKPVLNKVEPGFDKLGNQRYISTTKVPVINSAGKVIALVGIGRDVTDLKLNEQKLHEQSDYLQEVNTLLEERQEEIKVQSERIESERNQLRTLIDHMPDYIYIKDRESRFVTANDKLIRVMKAGSPQQVVGKTDFDFYSKEVADIFYNDELAIIQSGQPIINKEEIGFDEEGNELVISTTKVPIKDSTGSVIGLVGIGRDVTRQKLAERKLHEQADYLKEINVLLEERQEEIQQQSEELSAQTENLQEANQELEKLNATKNKFFSIIAHDLKNPFHAILGFTELLMRNYADLEEPRRIEIIELIKSSTESAYSLLENLLQWARTQTNRIQYTPAGIDLDELILSNISIARAAADNKNIHIDYQAGIGCQVYADKNMVNTILRNLVSNALKFTDPGGKVTVRCRKADDLHVLVEVEDTGIGISKESIDKLFQIDQYFSTAGTTGETGTGLGLIICREFVQKNKGELRVSSEINKGTTFSFTLPVKVN